MRIRLTRRDFVKSTAAIAAAPVFVPSTCFGANERLGVGMIGVGRQGQHHCRVLRHYKEVQIVAIADVDTASREQAAEKIRNIDVKGKETADIALYNDYRELLDRDDVDAVVICTPDHWHETPVIDACKAKKDIYCEKPLSLTIEEAWRMVNAVRKYDRVFQTGSMQRSSWNFLRACELVRNGYIGKVQYVHVSVGDSSQWCDLPEESKPEGLDWDFWLGQAPVRPFNAILRPPHNNSFPKWRRYREYSGGGMTDFGAHHFDIAQWGLGRDGSGPVEVHAPDGKNFETLTYRYDDGVEMYHNEARGYKADGIRFTGTDGWVEVNRGKLSASNDTFVDRHRFKFKDSDVRLHNSQNHHSDWLNAVKNRTKPICDVEVGASTVTVCHLGNIAYWTGTSFKYDPATKQIIGNDEAAALTRRDRRSPWDAATI